MPDNFFYNNFPRKSIPREVLALGLHLSVFGTGLGPDGHGYLAIRPYLFRPYPSILHHCCALSWKVETIQMRSTHQAMADKCENVDLNFAKTNKNEWSSDVEVEVGVKVIFPKTVEP